MNTNKEGITVVITIFNNSEYLRRSLNSVLNQTILPNELIIVNDGSESNHENSIKKLIANINTRANIRYYYKKNGGPSSARNFGIYKSIYNYICFLDVDDEMSIHNIEFKYKFMKKLDSTKYFGVYSNAKYYQSRSLIFSKDTNMNINSIGRKKGLCGSSPCYLFNKEILQKIEGFDENLTNNEDFDLIIRLLRLNYQFKYINHIGLIIHKTNNSVSRSNNFENKFISSLNFLNKAKKNDYFSINELNIRLKELHITYAKDMITNNYFNKKVFHILKKSFLFSKPMNLKEYFLYFLVFFLNK
tara:strand:+ start:9039 stop:9944 length:906 start_codon:yes stop_codon:yes gene_type:complete